MYSDWNSLKLQLEWVFFAFDSSIGNVGFGWSFLQFAAKGTQLFEENFLRMLGSLSLHIRHDFASLLQIKFCPVAHVHFHNFLRWHLHFRCCQKLNISFSHGRCKLTFTFFNTVKHSLFDFFHLLSLPNIDLSLSLTQFMGQKRIRFAFLFQFFTLSHQFFHFFFFFGFNVFVFKVLTVEAAEFFSFIDNSEQPGHSKSDFQHITVSIKHLLHLFAHKVIGLEFIFLFQHYVPQLVQVFIRFKSEFFGTPRTTSFVLLALVLTVAGEDFHVTRGRSQEGFSHGGATLFLWAILNLLEVMPIDTHYFLLC